MAEIDLETIDLEAVKERLNNAKQFAKVTGYNAHDYYDTIGEITLLIGEIERLRLELREAEQVLAQEKDTAASEIERWKAMTNDAIKRAETAEKAERRRRR